MKEGLHKFGCIWDMLFLYKKTSFYILGYPFELNKYRIKKIIFILFQKFGNLKS